MNRYLKLLGIAFCCATLSLSLRATEERTAEEVWELKQSDATSAIFDHREKLLEAEIASGAVPAWAGEYRFGDGLGVNVRVVLAPQGGFIYSWHGCLGLYDRNYGQVDVQNGRLKLSFELPNERDGFATPSEVYVPVRWGERLYLLGTKEAKDFANAVNAGFEPCKDYCSRFLVREGDAKKKVTGLPDLPQEFARYLLDKPIDANVVRVVESATRVEGDPEYQWRTTKVQIDVGRRDGVWTGMELHSSTSRFGGAPFKVVQVNEVSSIAVVEELNPDERWPEGSLCLSTNVRRTCESELKDSPDESAVSTLTTR